MRFVATLVASALLVAGCRHSDLVEAELRTKESELRDIRCELMHSESHNEALQRELHAFHTIGAAKIPPELGSQIYTLKEIVLGRQTGGYDDDGCPGDEALQVVLEPRDTDDHAIKAPGFLHVEAVQINPEGLKMPLSAWDVPPDQLRRTWRTGLLSTGYYVVLPWKNWPTENRLRVTARFTLADNRLFEADKDVTIRLTPAAKRPPTPLIVPGSAPAEIEMPLPVPQTNPPPVAKPQTSSSAHAGELRPAALWQALPPTSLGGAVQLLPPAGARR
jgi:hypothetical protein